MVPIVQGRAGHALMFVERRLEPEPDPAAWRGILASIVQRRGRFDQAVAAYERALDPNPANPRGTRLLSHGDVDEEIR